MMGFFLGLVVGILVTVLYVVGTDPRDPMFP
jgi:hypothetical protein